MGYQALYREWRPTKFDELVSQTHIVTTLRNAIQYQRISHAYLFSGPRGTGKTTVAKILAKSLNCANGPTTTPCGVCDSCVSHDEGRFLDLMEVDAASNRGIDEIREIRDHVAYPPSEGRYRVYIVDEVHMLTTEAFNALLKTLEEPPSYVVFVLATTEPHKLPMTVLSRCQRFDFHRIQSDEIRNRLREVCEEKGRTASDKSLSLIARKSDGGMRDALSLLDQCFSFAKSDEELTTDHVLEVIGSVSGEVFRGIMEAVSEHDVVKGLDVIQQVSEEGKDFGQFFNDLIMYLRDLLLVKLKGTDEELLWGDPEELRGLTDKFSRRELLSMIDFLSEKQSSLKWSENPRLVLEMVFYRLVNQDRSYQELKDRLAKLEQVVDQGVNIANLQQASTSDDNTNKGEPKEEPKGEPESRSTSEKARTNTNVSQKVSNQEDNHEDQEQQEKKIAENIEDKVQLSNDLSEAEPHGNTDSDSAPPSQNTLPPSSSHASQSSSQFLEQNNDKSNKNDNNSEALNLDFDTVKDNWEDVLNRLKKRKITAHAFVVEGTPVKVEQDKIVLGFNQTHQLHKERVEQREREVLEEILADFFGQVKVKCMILNASQQQGGSSNTAANDSSSNDVSQSKQKNSEADLTGIAKQEFGSDKVEVYKNY